MDDAPRVRGFDCFRDLLRDGQRLIEGNRALPDPLRRVVTFDELPDAGMRASGFLDRIDRGDVRMIERRERLRLAFEPRESVSGQNRAREPGPSH